METRDETVSLISAGKVQGTNVYNTDGNFRQPSPRSLSSGEREHTDFSQWSEYGDCGARSEF